jgi:hypothetical protein
LTTLEYSIQELNESFLWRFCVIFNYLPVF